MLIALSDGLHQGEKKYIDLQSALVGIDPSSLWDDSTFDEQALKALPLALKSILIRDVITLAHIDNDYTEEENGKLFDLLQMMDFPVEKVEAIKCWLVDYWALLEKGNVLFSQVSQSLMVLTTRRLKIYRGWYLNKVRFLSC